MAHPHTFSRPSAPRRGLRSLATLLAGCVAACVALGATAPLAAVQPQRWVHTTEADFQDGETEDVAITNLGDLKLARAVEDLAELPEGVSIVFDAQRFAGDLYVAGGPEGVLLKRTDDGFETVAKFPGEQVFCLHEGEDGLLVGVSGENSRVMTYDGEELREAVRLDEVRYLWDMETNGLELYLATGAEGRVLATAIDPDGAVAEGEAIRTLLDTEQINVLCLDRDDEGRLYAGTDTQGLVFRLTFVGENEVEPYVLLDAAEPEIGDLVVMPDGTVYAGTADANQARPGRLEQPPPSRPADPPPAAAGRRRRRRRSPARRARRPRPRRHPRHPAAARSRGRRTPSPKAKLKAKPMAMPLANRAAADADPAEAPMRRRLRCRTRHEAPPSPPRPPPSSTTASARWSRPASMPPRRAADAGRARRDAGAGQPRRDPPAAPASAPPPPPGPPSRATPSIASTPRASSPRSSASRS